MGKDTRLYLVRYKGKYSDKDEWIPEDKIPDGPIEEIWIKLLRTKTRLRTGTGVRQQEYERRNREWRWWKYETGLTTGEMKRSN